MISFIKIVTEIRFVTVVMVISVAFANRLVKACTHLKKIIGFSFYIGIIIVVFSFAAHCFTRFTCFLFHNNLLLSAFCFSPCTYIYRGNLSLLPFFPSVRFRLAPIYTAKIYLYFRKSAKKQTEPDPPLRIEPRFGGYYRFMSPSEHFTDLISPLFQPSSFSMASHSAFVPLYVIFFGGQKVII